MIEVRYRSKKREITTAEAVERRDEMIERYRETVRVIEKLLEDARKRLDDALESAPITTLVDFEDVYPGDPGYDDLPPTKPGGYRGTLVWLNSLTPQPKPQPSEPQ